MPTLQRCMEWIAGGRLRTEGLLTHRFPVSDYRQAIQTSQCHQGRGCADVEEVAAVRVAFDFGLEKRGDHA